MPRHPGLFQAYFSILQFLERLPWLIWLPVFKSRWLRAIQVPVLRIAIVVLAAGHIKRVIEALDRGYRLRLATQNSEQDDWKALHEQAESMKAGLPTIVLSRWLLAILAFVIVFLSSRVLPREDLALTSKMIVTAVTLNPEKLAELAAEPGAGLAIARLLFWLFALLIALVPIIVYHFRFKRMLFNSLSPPSNFTITTVWRQKFTNPQSLYALEYGLFTSLDARVVRELPFDLLATILAYGFHALGPGLVVGILAVQVFPKNHGVGWLLFFAAGVNMLIGLANVAMAIGENRRRAISAATG